MVVRRRQEGGVLGLLRHIESQEVQQPLGGSIGRVDSVLYSGSGYTESLGGGVSLRWMRAVFEISLRSFALTCILRHTFLHCS